MGVNLNISLGPREYPISKNSQDTQGSNSSEVTRIAIQAINKSTDPAAPAASSRNGLTELQSEQSNTWYGMFGYSLTSNIKHYEFYMSNVNFFKKNMFKNVKITKEIRSFLGKDEDKYEEVPFSLIVVKEMLKLNIQSAELINEAQKIKEERKTTNALALQLALGKLLLSKEGIFTFTIVNTQKLGPDLRKVAAKEKLQKQLHPKTLGSAVDNGNCFYDSFLQALPLDKRKNLTIEKLKLMIADYLKQLQNSDEPAQQEKLRKYESIIKNSLNLVQSIEEFITVLRDSSTKGTIVWGNEAIDGKILAELFHVNLVVHEVKPRISVTSSDEEVSLWCFNYDEAMQYTRSEVFSVPMQPTVEIALCNRHFVPIQMNTVDQRVDSKTITIFQKTLLVGEKLWSDDYNYNEIAGYSAEETKTNEKMVLIKYKSLWNWQLSRQVYQELSSKRVLGILTVYGWDYETQYFGVESIEGNLELFLQKKQIFTQEQIRDVFLQIASILLSIHNCDYYSKELTLKDFFYRRDGEKIIVKLGNLHKITNKIVENEFIFELDAYNFGSNNPKKNNCWQLGIIFSKLIQEVGAGNGPDFKELIRMYNFLTTLFQNIKCEYQKYDDDKKIMTYVEEFMQRHMKVKFSSSELVEAIQRIINGDSIDLVINELIEKKYFSSYKDYFLALSDAMKKENHIFVDVILGLIDLNEDTRWNIHRAMRELLALSEMSMDDVVSKYKMRSPILRRVMYLPYQDGDKIIQKTLLVGLKFWNIDIYGLSGYHATDLTTKENMVLMLPNDVCIDWGKKHYRELMLQEIRGIQKIYYLDEKRNYLLVEPFQQSLEFFLQRHHKLTQEQILDVFLNMANTLQDIHKLGYYSKELAIKDFSYRREGEKIIVKLGNLHKIFKETEERPINPSIPRDAYKLKLNPKKINCWELGIIFLKLLKGTHVVWPFLKTASKTFEILSKAIENTNLKYIDDFERELFGFLPIENITKIKNKIISGVGSVVVVELIEELKHSSYYKKYLESLLEMLKNENHIFVDVILGLMDLNEYTRWNIDRVIDQLMVLSKMPMNLKMTVKDAKETQVFEKETHPSNGDHFQKVKEPSDESKDNLKDCADLAASPAIIRLNSQESNFTQKEVASRAEPYYSQNSIIQRIAKKIDLAQIKDFNKFLLIVNRVQEFILVCAESNPSKTISAEAEKSIRQKYNGYFSKQNFKRKLWGLAFKLSFVASQIIKNSEFINPFSKSLEKYGFYQTSYETFLKNGYYPISSTSEGHIDKVILCGNLLGMGSSNRALHVCDLVEGKEMVWLNPIHEIKLQEWLKQLRVHLLLNEKIKGCVSIKFLNSHLLGALFLEKCDGDLYTLMRRNDLTLKDRIDIGLQMARIVYDINAMGYIVIDLKPLNILWKRKNQKFIVKLSDHQITMAISEFKTWNNTLGTSDNSTGPIGTLGYIPPSNIKKNPYLWNVWQLGVIISELLKNTQKNCDEKFYQKGPLWEFIDKYEKRSSYLKPRISEESLSINCLVDELERISLAYDNKSDIDEKTVSTVDRLSLFEFLKGTPHFIDMVNAWDKHTNETKMAFPSPEQDLLEICNDIVQNVYSIKLNENLVKLCNFFRENSMHRKFCLTSEDGSEEKIVHIIGKKTIFPGVYNAYNILTADQGFWVSKNSCINLLDDYIALQKGISGIVQIKGVDQEGNGFLTEKIDGAFCDLDINNKELQTYLVQIITTLIDLYRAGYMFMDLNLKDILYVRSDGKIIIKLFNFDKNSLEKISDLSSHTLLPIYYPPETFIPYNDLISLKVNSWMMGRLILNWVNPDFFNGKAMKFELGDELQELRKVLREKNLQMIKECPLLDEPTRQELEEALKTRHKWPELTNRIMKESFYYQSYIDELSQILKEFERCKNPFVQLALKLMNLSSEACFTIEEALEEMESLSFKMAMDEWNLPATSPSAMPSLPYQKSVELYYSRDSILERLEQKKKIEIPESFDEWLPIVNRIKEFIKDYLLPSENNNVDRVRPLLLKKHGSHLSEQYVEGKIWSIAFKLWYMAKKIKKNMIHPFVESLKKYNFFKIDYTTALLDESKQYYFSISHNNKIEKIMLYGRCLGKGGENRAMHTCDLLNGKEIVWLCPLQPRSFETWKSVSLTYNSFKNWKIKGVVSIKYVNTELQGAIFLEKCEGDLECAIQERKLSRKEKIDLVLQITQTVYDINRKGVVLMDLKLQNILLKRKQGKVFAKISDIGGVTDKISYIGEVAVGRKLLPVDAAFHNSDGDMDISKNNSWQLGLVILFMFIDADDRRSLMKKLTSVEKLLYTDPSEFEKLKKQCNYNTLEIKRVLNQDMNGFLDGFLEKLESKKIPFIPIVKTLMYNDSDVISDDLLNQLKQAAEEENENDKTFINIKFSGYRK